MLSIYRSRLEPESRSKKSVLKEESNSERESSMEKDKNAVQPSTSWQEKTSQGKKVVRIYTGARKYNRSSSWSESIKFKNFLQRLTEIMKQS